MHARVCPRRCRMGKRALEEAATAHCDNYIKIQLMTLLYTLVPKANAMHCPQFSSTRAAPLLFPIPRQSLAAGAPRPPLLSPPRLLRRGLAKNQANNNKKKKKKNTAESIWTLKIVAEPRTMTQAAGCASDMPLSANCSHCGGSCRGHITTTTTTQQTQQQRRQQQQHRRRQRSGFH